METPIPMEEKEKEEADLAKRAPKRSRYLSPPYTFPFTDDVALCGHGSGSEDLMAACSYVAVPDMLSALHAAALLDMDAANAGAGVELLRRFFTLHKSSSSSVTAEAEFNPSSSSQNQTEETSKPKKKKKRAAASTPTSRLLLTDVRNNLEKMIYSLLGRSPTATATATTSHGPKLALAGEMRGLLAKVDKMLAATTTTTPAHRH